MRLFHAIASAASVLLAACSSPPAQDPVPAAPADPESTAFDRAFRFTESAGDGSVRSIDPRRQLGEIDYKSRLTITPDAELLREIAGSAADVLPPLTEEETQRLELLRDLAELAQQLATLTLDLERELGSEEKPADGQVQALVQREQLLRRQLLEALTAGVRADVAREFEPETKEFEPAWKAREESFRRDEQGRPVALNSRRFQELLDARIRELAQALRRDRTRLEDVATALRLRAILHSAGKRMPIHVENYDTIDVNWTAREPRVGFGSADDQERMRLEIATLGALLRLRQLDFGGQVDARQPFDESGAVLRAARQGLRDAVREIRVVAGAPAGEGGLPELIALARSGAAVADQERLAALADFVASIEGVADAIEAARRAGASSGTRRVRDDDLGALVEQTGLLIERARKLDPVESTRVLRERLLARRTDLAVTSGELEPAIAAAVDNLRAALDAPLQQLDRLDLAVATLRARELMTPVAAAAATIDARSVPRPLHEVVPAEIDLNATIADRGDQLEVIAELVRRNGDEEEVFPSVRRTFPVDRLRLVNSLSADVAFVRQTSDDHFQPAPAAAWTLRYRLPNEPDDSLAEDLWQICDPGVGLSVHALTSDDESFQAGVGPHLSLFHDIVRAGWGYNLSADSNRGYVFVSIGIFETISGIGTLMTGTFGSGGGYGK